MTGWPGVRRSNAGSKRRTGLRFGFRASLRAPSAGRWLSEAMAEDRRRTGYDPDIKGGSLASHRWGQLAMTGAITGLLVVGMVRAGGVSPGGGADVFPMAALTNTVSGPEDSDGVGVVLRGDGHATEAEMAGGDGLVPGQAVERIFRISNRSDDEFGSIRLRTVATRISLLDSDPVNGLQLSLDACSVPWEERLDDSYSCPGREAVVLAPRAVIGDVALDGLSTTRPGGSDHLRLTMSLPGSADNRFQGQTSQIHFSFRGHS
jgi:spore coat-associated protein N